MTRKLLNCKVFEQAIDTIKTKSECNILNTEDLIRRLREETIPARYEMISSDVKSKFTNGPLEKSIYRLDFEKGVWWKENPDKHSKNNLKIITLTLHQSYISLSITISMWWGCNGLSLVPLLANIFMTPTEEDLILILKSCLCNCKHTLMICMLMSNQHKQNLS